ncbi:hypothetical protein [Limnochorda pilosa]|uniref:Glycosyltransferase n=1 Tax=Limnochorda pilosa TaxID=1555112 RepID=A0A0K2SNZ9_LIMPI|nr:hypothetical protein [Limnochorda pilosa]BAS28863.1 hypothetical protein LIP_3034 [Limnochorda pilosa]
MAVAPDDHRVWPPLKLDHLRRLTDSTGLLEHSWGAVPNPIEGYTVDDNARALALAARLQAVGEGEGLGLAIRYLSFLLYAVLPDGRFHNDVAYDRSYEDAVGAEDTQGRAAWGLGELLAVFGGSPVELPSRRLLAGLWPHLSRLSAPRAQAYALLGLGAVAETGDPLAGPARELLPALAGHLEALYDATHDGEWRWFEDRLAYANARLPQGLLTAARIAGDDGWGAKGLESLSFLWELLWQDDHLELVGNRGWHRRGGAMARFDQQPLDAAAMVEACLAAHEFTRDPEWYRRAVLAFEWFLGRNAIGQPLYHPETGGCRDGLQPDRVNANEGAESTLSYLLARLALERSRAPGGAQADSA